METKEGDFQDKDSIRKDLLIAGTAFLMAACLRRAVVLFLVEQWRVWVFLVLNLILLAIFFTSNPSTQDPSVGKKKKEIEKRQCGVPEKVEKIEMENRQKIDEEEEIEEQENDIRLSKEELNERVEAFIVMFKQHLISDAKKGRNNQTL